MLKQLFRNSSQDVIEERLNGSRWGAFVSELLSNSGHFLIFNALSEMALMSWTDYLIHTGHYLIVGAMFAQAWYLSRPNPHRFWGNFIGPSIYTLSDLPLEGLEFFAEPNHLILWCFAVMIATSQFIRFHKPSQTATWIIPLESLTRTSMVIALYGALIYKSYPEATGWESFINILRIPHHQFIIQSTMVVGLLLGLQTLQVTSQRKKLQETAGLLRNLAQWGMGNHAVKQAVINPEELGFRRRDRAILFMDIRGFTHWCEETSPDIVAAVLNSYYRTVEPAAAKFNPLRITLTADEIMAIYATPKQAIAAARAMQNAAETLLAPHQLGAGCALHYGSVIEGLFGSDRVRTYTAIGDVVNTAKRLESATPAGEITLSDPIYQCMEDKLEVEPREPIAAKGKTEPIVAWRLK